MPAFLSRPMLRRCYRIWNWPLPLVWGRKVGSVFFGGGTPSLLSGEALDRILSGVRALLPLEAGAEITLEANPGTVEAARFKSIS